MAGLSEQLADNEEVKRDWTERPWGTHATIYRSDAGVIHIMSVKPKARLSLRQNFDHTEHWTIAQGNAEVRHGEQIHNLGKGGSILIPNGTVHALENAGDTPLVLVQLQLDKATEGTDEDIPATQTYPAS